MTRIRTGTAVAASLFAIVCAPPAPGAEALTLDAVVTQALQANAQLRSLRAQHEALRARPIQARGLPNPMFRYSGMDMVHGGDFPDTNEKRFMLEQELPGFGKRGLRADMAAYDAEAMEREVETMTRDVVLRVKESYFELYAVQRVIEITLNEEGVLQRMERVAEVLYTTGEHTQQDLLKAQSEVTMLKPRLLDLEAQEAALTGQLNALLDRRPDDPLGRAETAPADAAGPGTEALLRIAEVGRPEIHGAEAQLARSQAERRLMAREGLPDYRLGVEYRDFQQGDDMVMFSVGLDLPLWRGKVRAAVREAESMATARGAELEAARRQVASEVWEAHAKLLAARQTLDLYRTELIPQAEARFKSSEAGYQSGKVAFLDLLESERFLLNARVMAAMAEGTLGMQLARLERAVGTDVQTDAGNRQGGAQEGHGP